MLSLLASRLLLAATDDHASWQDLSRLQTGAALEVETRTGEHVRGSFVRATDEFITLTEQRNDRDIKRPDVKRVTLRSAATRRHIWIGGALGAGAGAGIGALAGSALGSGSGGDFANLKGAVIGIGAGVGALIGMAAGSAFHHGAAVLYSAP